jgi:hypothetical protein
MNKEFTKVVNEFVEKESIYFKNYENDWNKYSILELTD